MIPKVKVVLSSGLTAWIPESDYDAAVHDLIERPAPAKPSVDPGEMTTREVLALLNSLRTLKELDELYELERRGKKRASLTRYFRKRRQELGG